MKLPENAAGALSAHLADDAVTETPNLDGAARSDAWQGDPGYWTEDEVPEETLNALAAQVENEQLPAFNTIRLL